MIAMKNILIYFDYPITSIQGGTEQASFLLARLLVRQGFRIIFLSLHPFKEKIMNSAILLAGFRILVQQTQCRFYRKTLR